MTELIKPDWQPSRPVKNWKEIAAAAGEMGEFIATGKFTGLWEKAWSLCHCQVQREGHFAFFVVHPKEVGKGKMFRAEVIVNPKIVEAKEENNKERMDEACMSFPHRQVKKVERYSVIKVRYQIRGWFGLKTVEETATELKAQIFQHEIMHIQGKNIYEIY